MRFLRLLILLPALCLGLLGQGHGLVLCQTINCTCLEIEGMCNCVDEPAHDSDCARAASVEGAKHCVCNEGEKSCHDVALGTDLHVAPKPVFMPDLARFALGALDWSWPQVRSQGVGAAAGVSARGPPPLGWEERPPQILACVRSVVMLV